MPDDLKNISVADDIAAAIASVEAPQAESPPTPETTDAAPAAESSPVAGERARGPDGKFLPKEGTEKAVEADPGVKAPGATQSKEAPTTGATAPAAAAADPPSIARWSDADKQMFRAQPKAAQDFLVRRHNEMETAFGQEKGSLTEFKRQYEPVDQIFAPYRQAMQQQGYTPATLIQAWAGVEKDLMEGRGAQRLAQIIKQYKIDPGVLARELGAPMAVPGTTAQPAADDGPQLAPEAAAAVERLLQKQFGTVLTPLQQQLQSLTQAEQQRVTRAQQERDQTSLQQVTTFQDAKDAQGNALHPHFVDVAPMMVQLATIERQAGRTPDLQAIYDQAVWANPATREKLLAADKAAQDAKANDAARAKAAQAKRASTSTIGAPPSGQASPTAPRAGPKSLREAIVEAEEEVNAA